MGLGNGLSSAHWPCPAGEGARRLAEAEYLLSLTTTLTAAHRRAESTPSRYHGGADPPDDPACHDIKEPPSRSAAGSDPPRPLVHGDHADATSHASHTDGTIG